MFAAASFAPPAEEERGPELQAAMAWVETTYGPLAAAPERFGEVDLDGDGSVEVLAYVRSPQTCGSGGCTLMVFDMVGGVLAPLGRIPGARLPVSIYPEKTDGFHDLGVTTAGGGYRPSVRRIPFAGGSYPGSAWGETTRAERAHGTIVIPAQ
ncbi:MAG: hypothetical protein CL808_00445 [Citromicrobium sp.]|nr:hypothetical protein [Citromicrobium sp.]